MSGPSTITTGVCSEFVIDTTGLEAPTEINLSTTDARGSFYETEGCTATEPQFRQKQVEEGSKKFSVYYMQNRPSQQASLTISARISQGEVTWTKMIDVAWPLTTN